MRIRDFYFKNHKKLLIIPLVLVALAFIQIGVQYSKTGDILSKDVSLSGGITATVTYDKPVDTKALEEALNKEIGEASVRELAEFGSSKPLGIIVEVGEADVDKLTASLEKFLGINLDQSNFSTEIVGSSLGESFYGQMLKAIMFSFILMAIVVFFTYRTFVPSIAVVFAAFMDIIVTLAIVNMIGMNISAAGISAFLLLIGYSIDTDILQTTRIIKRHEGTPIDRMVTSFKTGMTMTVAAFAAMGVGFIITSSPVIKEMFTIVLIGLIVDVIATYLMNSSLLLSYAERKGIK